MLQVQQHLYGLPDQAVGSATLEVYDEADPTGVVLLRRIVEPLSGRNASGLHLANSLLRDSVIANTIPVDSRERSMLLLEYGVPVFAKQDHS